MSGMRLGKTGAHRAGAAAALTGRLGTRVAAVAGALALLAAGPAQAADAYEISHGTFASNSSGVAGEAHSTVDNAGAFAVDARLTAAGPALTDKYGFANGYATAGKRFTLAPGTYTGLVRFEHLKGEAASTGAAASSGDVLASIDCSECSQVNSQPLLIVRAFPGLDRVQDEQATAVVNFTVNRTASVLIYGEGSAGALSGEGVWTTNDTIGETAVIVQGGSATANLSGVVGAISVTPA
ncbi:MAG: hypothetical protein QOI20_585 [Acidimicrobiaceae bacterium]|nr:hypothetical protein [Acidimicrobiaceae bacterium]